MRARVWYGAFTSDGPNRSMRYLAIFTLSGVWKSTAR